MINLISKMQKFVGKGSLVKDTRGLSTVEYVIILVLIAAAAVGSWKTLGGHVTSKLGDANKEIGDVNVHSNGQSAKSGG